MFLEIANNNGTKYIRICESVRVLDPVTRKALPKKKTVKNIGPVSRFDDGKPDFIERLKASYQAGNPIIDELKPFVNTNLPQEVYNIRSCSLGCFCIHLSDAAPGPRRPGACIGRQTNLLAGKT